MSLGSHALWGVEVDAGGWLLKRTNGELESIAAIADTSPIVSIHVAPGELVWPGFAREVARMARAARLDLSALLFEVSGRLRVSDFDAAISQMQQLRVLGVRFALDELGEGGASLQHLRRLPLDVVKLPVSALGGVDGGGEDGALLSAILRLASAVGLEVIATGIETDSQAEGLLAMGCALGQGPLFADAWSEHAQRPLSIEPVLGWRAWRLREREGVVVMGSITWSDAWPPGTAIRARCQGTTRHPGVPSESCSCGIYATTTAQALAASGVLSASIAVVGAIAMWGTVIEHTQGARSQFAYPSRVRLVCGACLAAGRGAVDPACVVASGADLTALCSRHARGRTGPRRAALDVQQELLKTYGIDLLPLERVSTALRRPEARRDLRGSLDSVAEGALMVIGFVLNAAMAIWAVLGLVFFAYWVVAVIVGVLTGAD